MRHLVIAILSIFWVLDIHSQENISLENIKGKWQLYVTNSFSTTFDFESNVIFEFESGIYKYFESNLACNEKKVDYISGSFVLLDNNLKLGESNWCPGIIHKFPEYRIIFINEDLFYSVSKGKKREPKTYTYFKRKS
jgi:hypothetical protein